MKILFFLLFLISVFIGDAQPFKGFDVRNASIPKDEIKDGGPPRDGIPSIDNPEFINIQQAKLRKKSRVLGVSLNGVAKAYPIRILNYHEIVNDHFNEIPVVVSFCPLCGSGIAFEASAGEDELSFGVSGLLYNSDVLMYDRETESLWSQLEYKAVSGPLVGQKLKVLPTENTTYGDWKERYPNSLVLSEDTGYERDYSRNPYPDYHTSADIYFKVSNKNTEFHPKEMVLGLNVGDTYKAYPFSRLTKFHGDQLKDTIHGKPYIIEFDKKSQSARVYDSENNQVPGVTTFWFAWYAFHPNTEVFGSEE